ncbi:MAG: hypothetical protein J0L88_00925 [Xanthomonadales bacterium]|nr:hypothetical protein [Xanthomonadales bacterium]
MDAALVRADFAAACVRAAPLPVVTETLRSRETDFFIEPFAARFAGAFFAGDFLAGAFFAGVFFAGAFRVGTFATAPRLAGVLRADGARAAFFTPLAAARLFAAGLDATTLPAARFFFAAAVFVVRRAAVEVLRDAVGLMRCLRFGWERAIGKVFVRPAASS